MKITNVEPILVSLPYEHGAPKPHRNSIGSWNTLDILFVKVDTDAGITGWGEAFGHASSPVTVSAISEIISKLAVGREIDDKGILIPDLTRRTQSMARGGPVGFALSGLDIALWDIAGKAANKPVWNLLGGSKTKPIPAYASLFRCTTPEAISIVSRKAVECGYKHIKLHEHDPETIAAARRAIGPNISLMVDTNCFWTSAEEIISICEKIQRYDIKWLEEPLYPADSYDLLAEIRKKTKVPFAAGENLGNFNDLRWLIASSAVDYIQPSIAKIGGITGLLKSAEFARQKSVKLAPHSPYLGPALVAAMHVITAMPEEIICEHRFCELGENPIGQTIVSKNGHLHLTDKPGLGLDIDLDVIQKFRRN